MKSLFVTLEFAFLNFNAVFARPYNGSFDTLWKLGAFEDYPAVATVEATSDGINFMIDSMQVQFVDTIPARPQFGSGALSPIAVDINMFTDSQSLDFVPGSNVATISPLHFGWDIQYTGVYRDGIDFTVVEVDSQAEGGTRSTNTLFDFGVANQIEIVFDTNVFWSLPLLDTPIGITFTGLAKPTQPVILTAVTEVSADFDSDGLVTGIDFLHWQRNYGLSSGASKDQGDADNNGTVDSDDLAIWKAQYGGPTPGSSSTSVPEPTTFALALAVFGLAEGLRCRNSQGS